MNIYTRNKISASGTYRPELKRKTARYRIQKDEDKTWRKT